MGEEHGTPCPIEYIGKVVKHEIPQISRHLIGTICCVGAVISVQDGVVRG